MFTGLCPIYGVWDRTMSIIKGYPLSPTSHWCSGYACLSF